MRAHANESRTKRVFPITRKIANLSAAGAFFWLGSCASTPNISPPPGSAIIEAKPDPQHRQGIEGIAIVSINGKGTHGTRSVIAPGLNTVRTRFRWPHGLVQEADLRFYATPGTVYYINYDVYPPRKEFKDGVAGKMLTPLSSGDSYAPLAAIVIGPPAAVVGIGERVARGVTQDGRPTTHIDLTVVAHNSGQGVVRQVRAYPDGRIDGKPWAAWAQMKAP